MLNALLKVMVVSNNINKKCIIALYQCMYKILLDTVELKFSDNVANILLICRQSILLFANY